MEKRIKRKYVILPLPGEMPRKFTWKHGAWESRKLCTLSNRWLNNSNEGLIELILSLVSVSCQLFFGLYSHL